MSSEYYVKLDDEARVRYKEKLKWKDVVLPDPYDEEEMDMFVDDITKWPKITMAGLMAYLVETPGPYTLQALKAYTSLQAYNFYESGNIRQIKIHTHLDICVLYGLVFPSQRKVRENEAYRCWIVATADGDIKNAHCNCKAGLGEVCSHVAAVLFAVEDAVTARNKVSCTSVPCYWKRVEKQVENVPICEMKFTKKPTYKKNSCGNVAKKHKQDHPTKSYDETENFIEKLKVLNPNARLFSVTSNESDEETDTASETGEELISDPLLPAPLTNIYHKKYRSMNDSSLTILMGSILDTMCLSQQQVNYLEACTRTQSSGDLWFIQRTGRITASKFHQISSLKEASSPIRIICDIMRYLPNTAEHSPSVQWGNEKESRARQAFIQTKKIEHQNLRCRQAGLYVLEDYPYLGASPDGIVECTCCGQSVLEIKCPFAHRNNTIEEAIKDKTFCLNADFSLKTTHQYYTQVQGQLAITGLRKCFFVIWTTVDFCVIQVEFNDEFWKTLLIKLQLFFSQYLLKELCTRRLDPTLQGANSETLYCFCQQPVFKKMIACNSDSCRITWYHLQCVSLKRAPHLKWFCDQCRSVYTLSN